MSQGEQKRSEVDLTRFITNDYWVVSLVRLPDKSKVNDEHAFLVLEGKTDDKYMIWFIDFVSDGVLDLLLPGIRNGKVRMDHYESNDQSKKLLFQGRRTMMDIKKGDRLLYKSWPIPEATAEELKKNIEKEIKEPPKFNIMGNSSSIKPIGHNCFTFARTMLHDLNDKYIKVTEDSVTKWKYSATSRVLVDVDFVYQRKDVCVIVCIAFLAGVAAVFIYAYFVF